MSPAPRVILLDSNAYFRLARSIAPLLADSFGTNPANSLYVLPVLDDEYLSNPRLRSKFEWVCEAQYKQDRQAKRYTARGACVAEIETAFSYLAGYMKANGLILAPEDVRALATGYARGFLVVSDDCALRQVADAHDIRCCGTLDLLKLMLDARRIDVGKVREVVEYWNEENDLPMAKPALREQYLRLFGEACPI